MNKKHLGVTPSLRLISIFFLFVFLYIIVIFNLYIIQIKKTDYFKNLGYQQYNVTVTTKPPRGLIYDRNNKPIAINKEILSAFIIPTQIEEPQKLKNFLSENFKNAYDKLDIINKSESKGTPPVAPHFMYVKRHLSKDEINLIENSNLSDIKLLKEPSRYYPIESIAPVVGFTDIDNQGIVGIELLYNNILTGKSTTHKLEKDARSGHFYFKRETKIKGEQPESIKLTIDSLLQFLVYEELKETVINLGSKEGSVLIMNPEKGDIIVMANYPDFDPNNTKDLDLSNTKNRIITDAYELGSVIKVFLAMAALEEKEVTPEELIDCENTKFGVVNGRRFTTTKANGIIPFCEVIQYSNNIGVAKVALRLGPKLYDHYTRLGFGRKIDIFPGENKGFITPPDKWSKASIVSLSFGYEISGNILQLAQAMGIIANNGFMVKPRFILDNKEIQKEGPLYSAQTILQIKEILRKTITDGAAKKANINGYTIIGKTGTARLITNGKYDPNRNIFTFAAIVEKGSYKRVVIIFIKETKRKNVLSSAITVPLFEQVAHKMLIHDKIL